MSVSEHISGIIRTRSVLVTYGRGGVAIRCVLPVL